MRRVVHISKNHAEAKDWDIKQAISMTPEQRQAAAKVLKNRVFGEETLDVKESHRVQSSNEK